ncbi:hypothetical protein BCM20_001721 [Clostridium beijerinckii]|uniref:hypothetical protein n=2 Tax=Clostridium beijerinckii TaxID=1520 RepID=UPI00184A8025|nr:hypothetical protein [Clostridium beijerinckii]NYC01766.1 hypothetical protein [Clostridium beijerinckii]
MKDDSLAGVCLMEQVDIQALEEKFGKLTNDNINKNGLRGLEFYNYPYYAYVQIDKDNEVGWISVGYPNKSDNTKFITSRDIGSESKFSDVLKAYGDNYAKKTYSDFMGSGDGYDVTYIDKEQKTSIEFEFNESDPYSNKKEEFLHYITLKKLMN